MVIAKTASRNVVYKATKLGESIFERQSEMLMPEEELVSQSYEEDFEDLSHNADLYPDDNVDFSTLTPTELIKLVHDGKKGH